MSYYIVNLYLETKETLYNPISGEYNKYIGSIFIPLSYEQMQKLNIYINLNNFVNNFDRMLILNVEQVNMFFYQYILKLVNKNNHIFNNQFMPLYHIIQFIETII
jgi:hypothetical protein